MLAKTSARQSQKFGRRRSFAERQLASGGRKEAILNLCCVNK